MEGSRRRQMAWTRPRPNMGKRSCLCFPEAPRWLPERLVRTTEAITGRANETTQDPGDSPATNSSADTGTVINGM